MKLRKLSVVLLALLVVLSLAGCGGGGGSYDDPVSTPNYLCFTSTGNSSIKMEVKDGTPDSFPDLKYSKDGTTWEDFIVEDTIVELADGEKVYLRGDNTPFYVEYGFLNFVMTGSIAASGNIMSLVDKTCESVTIPNNACFYGLFYQCTALTTAPELPATTLTNSCYGWMFYGCSALTAAPKLPATTLKDNCYSEMFEECTALTAAPELPATNLSDYCYYGMFSGCTALTAAPELPATTLAENCYENMFAECTNLKTAPELPATTLAEYCYDGMFYECTALTAAPELPATTLKPYCYEYMFQGCSSLNWIKVHFANNYPSYSTSNWVDGVADKGTFECPSDSSLIADNYYGPDGIPSHEWAVNPF